MTVRWSPDTCSCVLDVADDWNSAVVVQVCPEHAVSPFTSARGKNTDKNRVMGLVLQADPTHTGAFRYSKQGVLEVLNVALSNQAKMTLKQNISAQLGITVNIV